MPFGDKSVFESLTCQSAIKIRLYMGRPETWTLANPLSSEVKGRQLRFLGHSFRSDKEDRVNRSIHPVCTI